MVTASTRNKPARQSLAIEHHSPNPLAGARQAADFISGCWQRRPALIRQAFTAAEIAALTNASLNEAAMREMAADDETESRLIRRRGSQWRLSHGPFEPGQLPAATHRRWTLLVQRVDQHLDQASDLLHRFNFIPQVRLDDLMISIAGDQGGVGPHTDSYDVFLVQLQGRRKWTLGAPGDHPLLAGQPLKIIESFTPLTTLSVEPGDMLYVPPGWIHDGVADGPCTTASVGFRAPERTEVLSAWLQDCADRITSAAPDAPHLYQDATARGAAAQARSNARQSGRIPAPMDQALSAWIAGWQPTRADIQDFIGRYLTEPNASVWFDRPDDSEHARFRRDAKRNGVKLDRRTRISYRDRSVFINGEKFRLGSALPAPLKTLINTRRLDAAGCRTLWALNSAPVQWLEQWFEDGWLHADTP